MLELVIAASSQPLISAALAEQVKETGLPCQEAHTRAECTALMQATPAHLLLCDADTLPEMIHENAAAALFLSSAPLECAHPVLARPVRRGELLARIIRLAEASQLPLSNGWVFDPAERRVKKDDAAQSIALTEKEAQLLASLLAADGEEISRERLLQDIWGYQAGVDTHTLETHLYRLRAKLGEVFGGAEPVAVTPEGYRLRL